MDVKKYSNLKKELVDLCSMLYALPEEDIKQVLFMILYLNSSENIQKAINTLLDIPGQTTLDAVMQVAESERKKNERVKEK